MTSQTVHPPSSLSIKYTSPQLRGRDVAQNSVKCFAQPQADADSCSSFINQTCNPITVDHQIFQAWFALSEAMLAITNHLSVYPMSYCSLQEDLLSDAARQRGETDWSVVPWVFLYSLFKNRGCVSIFQSVVTSLWKNGNQCCSSPFSPNPDH